MAPNVGAPPFLCKGVMGGGSVRHMRESMGCGGGSMGQRWESIGQEGIYGAGGALMTPSNLWGRGGICGAEADLWGWVGGICGAGGNLWGREGPDDPPSFHFS